MAFTPAPTPPNSGDPANFNARADAMLGWFPGFVDQLNAELPFISSKGWATRGGTANAITLTAGFLSLETGMQVRFRAGASNTGATTINLDGLGAVACRTLTGAALPAGYIRTDVDTVATYNGTNWILDRVIERGTNANGSYVQHGDGTLICWSALASSATAEVALTFPAAFIAAPRLFLGVNTPAVRVVAPRYTDVTTTGANISAFVTGDTRVAVNLSCLAIGNWF